MRESADELVGLRRVHNAISSASSGNSVGIAFAVRVPTMRREDTSVTNAENAIRDQVDTEVKSTTHNSFGRLARNSRCTRSGGRAADASGRAVRNAVTALPQRSHA
jgi:hypothetical protein